jgi:hypothetical protein
VARRGELASRVHRRRFSAVPGGQRFINPVKWATRCGSRYPQGRAALRGDARCSVRRERGRFRLGSARRGGGRQGRVRDQRHTHLIQAWPPDPGLRHIVVTEPLSEARAAVGWQGREGVEDARNFMHFYRLTPDNRILAGGGPGLVPFAGRMDHDASPKAWAHLERCIGATFPPLRGIRITHRWGGAFSVTSDSTPQIGTLAGGGAAYSIGCTGHGVAMTHMNGRIIRDLVLGRKTELTQLWFVNRRSFPIPPEPLRSIAAKAVTTAMAFDDWWCDRSGRAR